MQCFSSEGVWKITKILNIIGSSMFRITFSFFSAGNFHRNVPRSHQSSIKKNFFRQAIANPRLAKHFLQPVLRSWHKNLLTINQIKYYVFDVSIRIIKSLNPTLVLSASLVVMWYPITLRRLLLGWASIKCTVALHGALGRWILKGIIAAIFQNTSKTAKLNSGKWQFW